MAVTIGIKAFNEERNIAAALASAVQAAQPYGGKVILADSGSTDRTVEVARQFPVRIVGLADQARRCCGAGAQLAFQYAEGDYFYLLDGDMVLNPVFLAEGIAFLETHPAMAAVAGLLTEENTQGESFQISADIAKKRALQSPELVDRLDGGGLYRIAAVREIGYFADRNLHGFEEYELGSRLRSRGWLLARINRPAVQHYGHTMGGYRLLWKRLITGYASGSGEVLRSAWGTRRFWSVLRELRHVHHCMFVILWWLLLLLALASPSSWQFAVLLVVPLLILSIRRRSLRLGLYSFAAWNVSACGMIAGLLRSRLPPDELVEAVDVTNSPEISSSTELHDSAGIGAASLFVKEGSEAKLLRVTLEQLNNKA